MASKIVKANGAQPDEFELSVAQELANLEVSDLLFYCAQVLVPNTLHAIQAGASELKSELAGLTLSAAKELDMDGGRKAIIIFVPYRQLKSYQKVHPRLVRELEKKFR